MKELREWVDVSAKLVLAVVAAIVGYYFSFQKQQNEDIKLVVDMATAEESSKRLMGASIAQSYFKQKRIPQEVYSAVYSYANNLGDQKFQAVVNSGAVQVSKSSNSAQKSISDAGSALPIRIYFHITKESDRKRAAEIEKAIESAISPASNSIVVPGIQYINVSLSKSILKCFDKTECEEVGPKLVAMFEENNVQIKLLNQSEKYKQSTSIRPNHFEAWFASGIPSKK